MATVAFVIDSKNEEDTIKALSGCKSQLAGAKILATRTEKNKIEGILDTKKVNITYVTSLDVQGEKTILAKAQRKEIAALFYISPNTEQSFLPRFVELLSTAVKSHVLIALNQETAEAIVNYLHGRGAFKEAVADTPVAAPSNAAQTAALRDRVSRQPSVAVQQLMRSQTVAEKESKVKKVLNWSRQQLLYWLDANELEYLKPLFSSETTNPEKLSAEAAIFDKHDTKNNLIVVKRGTPERLLDILTLPQDAALKDIMEWDEFVRDWFMTFHWFLPPRDFLKLLRAKYVSALEEYEAEEGEEIVESVLNALMMWIELEKGADFYESADLTRDFNEFIELIGKKNDAKATELKSALSAAIDMLNNPPEPDLRNAAPSMLTKKKIPPGSMPAVIDVEPLELARQITLMEASLLRKVRAKEFHGAGFSKRNAEEIAPNLTKVINLSNHVTNWIITEILKMKTVEEMAEMISKFIKVGKHMQQMHNFSGVCEISSALNNAAIAKLKAAWQILPPKTKEVMDEINEAVSPLAHYKNYREAFKARDPEQPCLPILVATLADLIVFEEVLNSKLPDGSVNWNKMTKVAERIWETVALNCVYPIRPVPELIQYIESSAAWRESATTCAIADLKMKEITKANDKTAENKKSKRRSTSSFSLVIEPSEGPKDELSESDWKILLTGSQPIKFKNGEVILKTGIPNEHLFRIKEGKVKVVKEIDGNMIAVATMGDGAMFGEISMLNRSQKGTTTASIVADGEVEIWQLQIDFVLHMLESKPALAEKLHRILAIKLARRLRDLGSKKPEPSARRDEPKEERDKDKRKKKEEEEKKEPEAETPNSKFNKKFKLDGEVIIRELECSYKGSMTMHGSLFISQNYIGVDFSMFGSKKREAIPFSSITGIIKSKKNINITAGDKSLVFSGFADYDDAFQFIRSIWTQVQKTSAGGSAAAVKPKPSPKKDSPDADGADEGNKWLPSTADWELILKGARTATFKKDDVIIREGEQFRRIFQLFRGECRFEKVIDGKSKVLGKMGKDGKDDNLFGEISFLEGGRASASVVCDKDDTQIAIIEGYFLEVLFEYYPELSGRFFHYLAHVLSKRLKQREFGMNNTPALKESSSSNDLRDSKDKKEKKRSKKHSKKESSKDLKLSKSASETEDSGEEGKDKD